MSIRRSICLCIFCFLFVFSEAQDASGSYRYSIDLNEVANDQFSVELLTPVFSADTTVFHLPKIVPGTYSIYDFGRFVEDFKAYDNEGNQLFVERMDTNNWKINNARKMTKIIYKVNDSFDDKGKNFIFQPSGSDIEKDTVYLFNTFCLFGYFDDIKNIPFDISITKPPGFYGSTALLSTVTDDPNLDRFLVSDYMKMADSPIMYCRPDTATLIVGNTTILFSVYSQDILPHAKELSENFNQLMGAIQDYFGGKLPVDKYAFIVYLFDRKNLNKTGYSMGALEHGNSSCYYMPTTPQKGFTITDVASHEFLHIITPLNFHSKEIGNFNYMSPNWSEHLWLYEGSTEYNANYIQLRDGLMSFDDYLDLVESKAISANSYNDTLPMTVLSKNCIEMQDEYLNIYQKGALINLCLDIKLRELSSGKYGLKNLIQDLSKKYGQNQSFEDSTLFDEITSLTYPEIRAFFTDYVEGKKTVPYSDFLAKIGVDFKQNTVIREYTLGYDELIPNLKLHKPMVPDDYAINDFGKILKLKAGDVITKVNGVDFNFHTADLIKDAFEATINEGDLVVLSILRRSKKGNFKEIVLSAPAEKVDVMVDVSVSEAKEPTAEQIKLREAWLDKQR